MTSTGIWVLLVHRHDSELFQAIGMPTEYHVKLDDENINRFKTRILSFSKNILQKTDPTQISVWRTEDKMTLLMDLKDGWKEVLKKVDIEDRNTFKSVSEDYIMKNVKLSTGQILLLWVNGMSCIFTVPETFSDNLVDGVVHQSATIDDELEDVVLQLKQYTFISQPLYSIEFTKMVIGYLNILKTPGPSPSHAAKSPQYRKSQGNINQTISTKRYQ